MGFKRYYQELKRRKVFKAAVAYLAVAWALVEIASAVLPVFETPPVILKSLIILLILGFPVNLVFSWVYDVTPEGIKKTDDASNTKVPSRIKGRRLNRVIIGFLSLAVLILLYNQFVEGSEKELHNGRQAIKSDIPSLSVAVLPFKNYSGNPELEHISEGMTGAVISRLAEISSLEKVVPFTTMLTYKNSVQSLDSLSQELHVSHILQGNFMLAGNQVRIALQLIEGDSEKQVWADEFTGAWNIQEVFDVYDRVTQKVLDGLQLGKSIEELAKSSKIPTDNLEAYNTFLLAERQRREANQKDWDKAIPLYEKAIQLDPEFVEPYASLAQIYTYRGLVWGYSDEQESREMAKYILVRAKEIDSSHRDVIGQRVSVQLYFDWDFEGLDRELDALLKTSERKEDILNLFSDFLLKVGRYKEGLGVYNRRIERNPVLGESYGKKAEVLYLMGRYDSCDSLLHEFDGIFSDGFYLRESAKWHFYLGNIKRSQNQLARLTSNQEDPAPILLWLQAVHEHAKGASEESLTYLDHLKEKYHNNASGSPAWFTALYYAYIRADDNALNWLEKSFERHEVEMIWLRAEPLLAPFRRDSRYLRLYREIEYPTLPLPATEAIL